MIESVQWCGWGLIAVGAFCALTETTSRDWDGLKESIMLMGLGALVLILSLWNH